MSRRENPNGNRRIAWQNVLTVFSAAILIGAEVFGAAFAGGWAVASYLDLGPYGVHAPRPASANEKNSCQARKHRLCAQLPNFARACGRVSVGGHPDKRPDSRPEQDRRLSTAIV